MAVFICFLLLAFFFLYWAPTEDRVIIFWTKNIDNNIEPPELLIPLIIIKLVSFGFLCGREHL